jgi:tRNA-Thr(GGU) m(6)t(6)A37 methyltransferase TsaA
VELQRIGVVESSLTDPAVAPKQGPEGAPDAWVVFAPDVLDGLRELRAGDRIILITWLDQARRDVLRVHPRDDPATPQLGVFSTRSADRPNPLGLHEVEVLAVQGERVHVRPLEAVDGTPVVDVKPVLGAQPPPADEGQAVEALAALVGEWEIEMTHPSVPSTVVHGRATVEWLEGERFLIHRSRNEHPDFPDSISVIGSMGGGLAFQYFDSRGVHRVYGMSMDGDVWRLWRVDPSFRQRFTGRLLDGGATLSGQWELAEGGGDYVDDLQITYRRMT